MPLLVSLLEQVELQLSDLESGGTNIDLLGLLRRQWHPTPVLLPVKSHGQRSLVGCSP